SLRSHGRECLGRMQIIQVILGGYCPVGHPANDTASGYSDGLAGRGCSTIPFSCPAFSGSRCNLVVCRKEVLMSIRYPGRSLLAVCLVLGVCAFPAPLRADQSDDLERQRQEIKRLQIQLEEVNKKLAVQEKEIRALRDVQRLQDLVAEGN